MLTLRLCGGLGNQLFQWALGVALEWRGNQVQYDTTLLDQDRGRRYLLCDFGLKLNLTKDDAPITVQEKGLRFDPAILELKGNQVLNGYWQTDNYFASVGDYIRQTLFRKTILSRKTLEITQQIKELRNGSCFVHVRRTDNLRPTSTMYHGLTNAIESPYYGRALAKILELPDIHFFIFSDDPEWCAANFKGEQITVVSHNTPSFTVDEANNLHKSEGGREVEDLWLMSLCHHAIIANSTFSWFGAWLNNPERYDRTIIAPDPWFNPPTDLDSADIIPERWTKCSTRSGVQ